MKRTIHYCVYTAWCACHHDFGIFLPSFAVTALLSHMKWCDISLGFLFAFLWWLSLVEYLYMCSWVICTSPLKKFLLGYFVFNWLAYLCFSFWFTNIFIHYIHISLSEIWFANMFFPFWVFFFFYFVDCTFQSTTVFL